MSLPTEQFPNDESAPLTPPDVAWLREARAHKGLTLEHLANTTKICPKILTALEAGAIDKLPPVFFTRGFLKAYAKEIGLDPNATADRYLAQLSPIQPKGTEDVRAIVETAVARTPVIGYEKHHAPLISSLHGDGFNRLTFAAAIIGAVVYLGSYNWDEWALKLAATGAADSSSAAVSPAAVPAPALEAPPTPLTEAAMPGGSLQFEMKPQGECWFSAAADGTQLRSELLKTGDLRPFEVRDELVLRVGDPGACAFSINGRAGRPLGSPGAPVTVRITKDNFRDFLSS